MYTIQEYLKIYIDRIGLSIVVFQQTFQHISEHVAIIDKPEELNCGVD
jgi:hypothetical protein